MSTAPFVESFFDDNYQKSGGSLNFRMWVKPTVFPQAKEIVFSGFLYKQGSKPNTYKLRFYKLTPKQLFYYKNETDEAPRGQLDIKNVRNEYFINDLSTEHKFGIKFVRNLKFFNLFAKKSEVKEQWQLKMAPYLIQSDFHNKFGVLKIVGKGSFAKVYLVEDNNTKKQFAVKAFSKEYLNSQSNGRASLLNEVELLRACRHPHILYLEEIHESKNSIYLVMEMLEGGELVHKISEEKMLKQEEIRKIIGNLVSALAYLEEKRIMHRDLKPENLILKNKKDNTNICIVDFGLGSFIDVDEYIFKRCGTPGFVAPEIANASSNSNIKFDAKCDVFSAGIIFYILSTGKFPFEAKHFKEVLQLNKECKINFELPALKKMDPNGLNLLQRMCMIDPKQRISAKEAMSHKYFASLDLKSKIPESELVDESLQSNLKNFSTNYNQAKGNMEDIGSIVIQSKYITGETNSITDSPQNRIVQGAKQSGVPVSIDLGKKAPLVRGGSERGLPAKSINNTLYKTTLQKQFQPIPEDTAQTAYPDSFNSMESEEEKGTGRAETNPKIKMKASSFRNPKP